MSHEVLAESTDPRIDYLLGLLSDDNIQVHRYADDGPPSGAARIGTDEWGATVGWLGFKAEEEGDRALLGSVTVWDGKTISQHAVMGRDMINLACSRGKLLYADRSAQRVEADIRSDVLTGAIAEAIGADLLITRRPILLTQPFDMTGGTACLSPDAALPIVGLYLRQQGHYVIDRDVDGKRSRTINRGGFWWAATRDLLPAGWSWMSACVAHSMSTKDDTLTWLAGSVHQRLDRALRARDRIHANLLVPQDNDTADEALAELDVLLVSMMGAFDAAANVADIVLGLGTSRERIGWQRKDWIKAVGQTCSGLVAVLRQRKHEALLTVLRLLRNSVHGEALPPLAMAKSVHRRDDTLVGLPRAETKQILTAVEAIGGAGEWGMRELVPGRLHADVRKLVEHLVPRAASLLNSLIEESPVDRLSTVDVAGLPKEPPERGVFAARDRQKIRWQLGLD